MLIVVMGVAGSGKTAVGSRLAEAIGATFYDADDFHSAAAVEKMAQGIPLDDHDRMPWLNRLVALLESAAREQRPVVLACSALKERYRAPLRAATAPYGVRFQIVYLRVSVAVATTRVLGRAGHFMPSSLVESQFDALEEPTDAVVVDADQPLDVVVAGVRASLGSS